MFEFIKKVFVVGLSFFSCNTLKFVLMNNQDCIVRPEIIIINSNKLSFYLCSVKIDKCSGSCNNINDLYAKLCVPYVIKNIIIKVMKQGTQNSMKLVNANVDQMQVFVIINKCGIMINADRNAKN